MCFLCCKWLVSFTCDQKHVCMFKVLWFSIWPWAGNKSKWKPHKLKYEYINNINIWKIKVLTFFFFFFLSCRVQNPVSMTMHQSKTQKFMVQQKNYHTHTQVHGVGPTLNRAIPLSVGHNPINGKYNPAGSLWIQCFSQQMNMSIKTRKKHCKVVQKTIALNHMICVRNTLKLKSQEM